MTSVEAVGSYGGLTLTGTVTGSGQITLGGTPTGTWPISITGNASSVNTVQVSTNADFYLTFADANNGSPTSEFLYTIGSVKVNPSTGALTAGSFVKSGGTSSQYLMADGSVSTGSGGTVTGTGTTNYIPKFTGASAIGNSLIYDNGTNVGIGTTSPTDKLDVNGVIRGLMPNDPLSGAITAKFLSFSGNPYGLIFRGYATGAHSIQSQRESSDSTLFPLSLQPLGGNVGIGTTSPAAKLTVNGQVLVTDNSLQGFYQSRTSDTVANGVYGGNSFVLRNGATSEDLNFDIFNRSSSAWYTPMVIKNTGNVGIGTTSPNQLLHIEKDQNTYTNLRVRNNDAGSSAYTMIGLNSSGNSWGMRMGSSAANSNRLDFVIDAFGSPVERMSITSGGNVGIGTTSPTIGKLQINAVAGTDTFLALNSSNTGAGCGNILFNENGTSRWNIGTTADNSLQIYNQGVNAALYIRKSDSNVGIGTTSPATKLDVVGAITASGGFFNSDMRLKDLTDYDYNVSDIKPITYLWKDGRDDKKHVGYSAQEVQKVMPDAVNEGTDGMLSVNYVEVLVAKIAELENRIKQLEK